MYSNGKAGEAHLLTVAFTVSDPKTVIVAKIEVTVLSKEVLTFH